MINVVMAVWVQWGSVFCAAHPVVGGWQVEPGCKVPSVSRVRLWSADKRDAEYSYDGVIVDGVARVIVKVGG